MKKTFFTIILLANTAFAASISYDEMTAAQQSGIIFKGWSDVKVSAQNTPWANIDGWGTTPFTVSFDISNITGIKAGEVMVCLSGSHLSWGYADGALLLTLDDNNNVVLLNHSGGNSWATFFDGSTRGDTSTNPVTYTMCNSDLGLSVSDSQKSITTITLVSDPTAKTFSMYNNGKLIATQSDWNTDTGVVGLQLGTVFGGATDRIISGTVDIDNLYYWKKALSESEIKSLIIPEPTTATLSLLALAGLAARRRRK